MVIPFRDLWVVYLEQVNLFFLKQNFTEYKVPLLYNKSIFQSPINRQFRNPLPSLLPSTAPHEIEMKDAIHRFAPVAVEHAVQGSIRSRQEHVLLHPELGQMVVLLADDARMRCDADELAHVAVVLVLAGPLEDLVPGVGRLGDHGFLLQDPTHLWFRAAHAGVEHHAHAAGVLEQAGFLGRRQRRFG